MPFFKGVWFFLLDTLQTIFIAVAIFIITYAFLLRPFEVNGSSMDPTFREKEFVLTNIIGLRFEDPKRGDVIVFHSPVDEGKDFIKRVVGLPGEIISLNDGKVFINNQALDENMYLLPSIETHEQSWLKENESRKIPLGHYFVMGDNRRVSRDSRDFGPIEKKAIIGKSFFVYLPIQHARKVENPFTN